MNAWTNRSWVRPPAVAGRFYPADKEGLRQEVEAHLAVAAPLGGRSPKAVIAPHAGYPYSGPIAGSAFVGTRSWAGRVNRVAILGPAHYESFPGIAVSSARAFETPAGEVPIDLESVERLLRCRLVVVNDEAHAPEHSLEVELPFLQAVLTRFEVVPLLVGVAEDEEVAEVLAEVWGGDETAIVISSDLSHYQDYRAAQRLDRETAEAVEELEPERVDSRHACGWLPMQGLLRVAKAQGLRASTLDLRNSGDTAGSRERVVGYGAWAFEGTEVEP
jgi:MEMO1 family protein